jgi:DNA-binding protein HU-beta
MTKTQLVKAISEAAKLSLAQTEAALDGLTAVVQQELKTPGNEVALVGIGKLKSVAKPARQAKQFGVMKDIPAHVAVQLKVSGVLKDAINQ